MVTSLFYNTFMDLPSEAKASYLVSRETFLKFFVFHRILQHIDIIGIFNPLLVFQYLYSQIAIFYVTYL